MDHEMLKLRRYMLHHRIITYAIILFLILITFILMSISRQIQNEQALLLDSQAANSTAQGTVVGSCPANGIPARMTYNGASSCYFGQYRSISVRCTDGVRAQIINSSTVGSFSVCADKSVLEAAAKARCGCTGGGQGGSGNPAVPTVGVGSTAPGQPTPTGILIQGPLPTNTPTPLPTSNLQPTGSVPPQCPRGLKTFTVGTECANQVDVYKNATYICNSGKKGTLFIATGSACKDAAYFLSLATAACKNAPNCPRNIMTTPTSAPFPTTNPND